mgnify:FL=1
MAQFPCENIPGKDISYIKTLSSYSPTSQTDRYEIQNALNGAGSDQILTHSPSNGTLISHFVTLANEAHDTNHENDHEHELEASTILFPRDLNQRGSDSPPVYRTLTNTRNSTYENPLRTDNNQTLNSSVEKSYQGVSRAGANKPPLRSTSVPRICRSFECTGMVSSNLNKSQSTINEYLDNIKQGSVAHESYTANPDYNPEKQYFKDPEIQKIALAARARKEINWRDASKQREYFELIKESGLFNEKFYGLPEKQIDSRLSQIQGTLKFVTCLENIESSPPSRRVANHLTMHPYFFPEETQNSPANSRPILTNNSSLNVLRTSSVSAKKIGNKEVRGVRPSFVNVNEWVTAKKEQNSASKENLVRRSTETKGQRSTEAKKRGNNPFSNHLFTNPADHCVNTSLNQSRLRPHLEKLFRAA